jgi:hypothetical protein
MREENKLRHITALVIFVFAACGCSSQLNVTSPDESAVYAASQAIQNPRWTWDLGLYMVSADHARIDKLPVRLAGAHMNVTPFLECPKGDGCLKMGQPLVQADGTIKVSVILTHPFPGIKKYTGFDVRGTIMFPATRYWRLDQEEIWLAVATIYGHYVVPPGGYLPVNFSREEDGGGQLLNADGCTFYLSPWLDLGPEFEAPIFNYSRADHAYGPDPDSTVNGFKLFTNDPDRRMFRVTDTIKRTYHIAPPDGEFIFGYVVDAYWVPPETTPVVDPKTDFPFWANAEEGYVLELEQIAPFKLGTYTSGEGELQTYAVTRVKFLTYEQIYPCVCTFLLCPDIIPEPENKGKPVAYGPGSLIGKDIKKEGPGQYSVKQKIEPGTYSGQPGRYLAVLFGEHLYNSWPGGVYSTQFCHPPFFDFVYIDVIE